MVMRSKAQRRADTDSLSLVWPKGRDTLDRPMKQAQATVQTVRYQSDGVHFKSRFEAKEKVFFKRYGRD
jgi:hypothetical protein